MKIRELSSLKRIFSQEHSSWVSKKEREKVGGRRLRNEFI